MAIETTTGGAVISPRLDSLFTNVLVGVDRSAESVEAARQAGILATPDAKVTLLSVWTLQPPTFLGLGAPERAYAEDDDLRRSTAEAALAEAKAGLPAGASPNVLAFRGRSWEQLLATIDDEGATLVAVGCHCASRTRGIVTGSTATEIVHKAPCSVLVARRAGPSFPARIVVGVDGSPESADAYAVAVGLAERFDAKLWPVVAHGGKGVDRELVATIVDYHHEDLPDEPVRALVAASTEADLIVVGSRGLHGLKALGSVSERVAHEAWCSTLIVR
jgi:nucleotide-binding universal stress UspA family protein